MSEILGAEDFDATLADYGEGRGGWSALVASHEALRAERDDALTAANGLSADLSQFGRMLERAEGQRLQASAKWEAAEDRVRVLEADIEAVWDQYREACGILNDRVRVLTEALALIRDGRWNSAHGTNLTVRAFARSVLASVPSEPVCPTCGSRHRTTWRQRCPDAFHSVPSEETTP
jgi:hypothetical protein